MMKKVAIGAAVVLAVVLLAVWLWPSKKSVSFKIHEIEEGSVQKTVTATGYVQPADEVEVGTQVSGIVEKLFVTYNSKVKKGQVLAELDKSTLLERLSQTQATKASAESALNLAKQNYERTKTLYEHKAATQQSFEEATNSYVQAQNTFLNAETNVREAKVNLSYATITSPIDGIVLDKQVEEGQTVASSFSTPTLFVIAKDLKNMHVEANIDEADIGAVKLDQNVTFTVDAYSGEEFHGKVAQIRLEPTVTSNVVTYTVVIKAENPEEKLFPGMTASITIVTDKQDGIVVPMSALSFTPTEEVMQNLAKPKHPKGEGKREHSTEESSDEHSAPMDAKDMPQKNVKRVWMKTDNGGIRPRPVEIGMNDGVNAIVKAGLAAGDSVIISAQVGEKQAPQNAGQSPFMPQRPNRKSK